jgi:hypothetical protein
MHTRVWEGRQGKREAARQEGRTKGGAEAHLETRWREMLERNLLAGGERGFDDGRWRGKDDDEDELRSCTSSRRSRACYKMAQTLQQYS